MKRNSCLRLGQIITNPSNFCEIRALTDDQVTKEILAHDREIGSTVAEFYRLFLELIDRILVTRHQEGIELNETPNFMLSLRLRYHGQTVEEIAADWGKMIVEGLESIIKKDLSEETKQE